MRRAPRHGGGTGGPPRLSDPAGAVHPDANRGRLWAPRITTNSKITIQHNLQSCQRTGRIQNFVVAARQAEGAFQGVFGFDDSDVYKMIEGAAYTLGLQPDPVLDHQLDDVIAKIAAAQEPDATCTPWARSARPPRSRSVAWA